MAILFLVTESSRDSLFYQKCAARLSGREFSWWTPRLYRKGDGSGAVRIQLKYALRQAKAAAEGAEEVCFIGVIDNDRAAHEENAKTLQRHKLSGLEQNRPSRLQWMSDTVTEVLGSDTSTWKLRVAVAVPVEMLECWIVKALGAELPGGPLPHFSRQDQQKARAYYHPVDAPLQWKDLEQHARDQCGLEDDDAFYELAACEIADKADLLANLSLSFRLFKDQVGAWP